MPTSIHGALQARIPFLQHDPWNLAERIEVGEFCFLNRSERLGRPIDWSAEGAPLLWQYNLHYFHYLHLLSRDVQINICKEWIAANPCGRTVGWRPYPASLRIVNWCKANLDDPQIDRSLYEQAAYLYRNVEDYHPGNHVLENAKALVFAGRYFHGEDEAATWLEQGLNIFSQQTPIQVLEDGGYFERSPMYHALILEGYADILNILEEDHPDIPWLRRTVSAMADFLTSLTHPDGWIALFNDSTIEIASTPAAIGEYISAVTGHVPQRKAAFLDAGYFVHESADLYLIIDGGPVGPDFLPAHAHADIFSYELSLKGVRVIVDSGVFEYQSGPMRSYVRSTRAHNTLCIDGVDQAECWGSFRVARRYHPTGVRFEQDASGSKFEGSFDGYAHLIGDGIRHRRTITCNVLKREIVVDDEVEGSGSHVVESLIHLNPNVQVEISSDAAKVSCDGASLVLRTGNNRLSIEDSWYCPEFGLKQHNKTLVISGSCQLPTRLTYVISY